MKKNINREQYQKKLRRKKRRLRPRLWFFLVLVTIFITMIIYSCSTLFNWNQDNKDVKKIEEAVNQEIITAPTSIRLAAAGNYSGMIGAALLGLEKLI